MLAAKRGMPDGCRVRCQLRRMVRLLASLAFLVACSSPEPPGPANAWDGEWVDLTHPFAADTLYWPTAPPFELTVESRGTAEGGYWYEAYSFRGAEHGGTHVDAPSHFAEGQPSVDAIPLDRLIGPACVVDVSAAALANPDYQVTTADLAAWEGAHGPLPAGAIVLLRTGYGRFWPDAARYLGTSERGQAAVAKLRFPGLHPDAAQWLVRERRIDAIGIDTPSIDYGQSRLFKAHRVLFAAAVPAFENLANLHRLPATGAQVVALPMKIRGGSGGPLRIVAMLP